MASLAAFRSIFLRMHEAYEWTREEYRRRGFRNGPWVAEVQEEARLWMWPITHDAVLCREPWTLYFNRPCMWRIREGWEAAMGCGRSRLLDAVLQDYPLPPE